MASQECSENKDGLLSSWVIANDWLRADETWVIMLATKQAGAHALLWLTFLTVNSLLGGSRAEVSLQCKPIKPALGLLVDLRWAMVGWLLPARIASCESVTACVRIAQLCHSSTSLSNRTSVGLCRCCWARG